MGQDRLESRSEALGRGLQHGAYRGPVELGVTRPGRHPGRGEQSDLGHRDSLLHCHAVHVLVLRHGITAWNATGRWQGWEDVPLAPEGELQADRAGLALAAAGERFDRFVSSDLVRARQTAERIVAALVPSAPIDEEWGLRERDIGAWSGKHTGEIEAQWPGWLDAWRRGELDQTPDGEHEPEFRSRITSALEAVLRAGPRSLVVTHGGVIRTLEVHYGVTPEPVGNISGRWFGLEDGAVVLGPRVDLVADLVVPVSVSL